MLRLCLSLNSEGALCFGYHVHYSLNSHSPLTLNQRLPSFATWTAFPSSDYYEGSAPDHPLQPQVAQPYVGPNGQVPTFTR